MRTRIIENGRHRILIGEHLDSAFISAGVDGTSIGGFFTPDQLMELAGEAMAIARRIRKRG